MRFAGICLSAAVILVPAQSSMAQRGIPDATVREGTLSFDGRATVGDFVGSTSTVTGEMHGGTLGNVRGWVEAPVETLKTGNGKRDKDLNKSMESAKYPNLRFDLDRVSAGDESSDSLSVTLHGAFQIHGVSREVELPATVMFSQDTIRVRSDFPMNLKDYKIGGLSKFLGMFKMYEDIVVHVDLVFAPATAPHPAGET